MLTDERFGERYSLLPYTSSIVNSVKLIILGNQYNGES